MALIGEDDIDRPPVGRAAFPADEPAFGESVDALRQPGATRKHLVGQLADPDAVLFLHRQQMQYLVVLEGEVGHPAQIRRKGVEETRPDLEQCPPCGLLVVVEPLHVGVSVGATHGTQPSWRHESRGGRGTAPARALTAERTGSRDPGSPCRRWRPCRRRAARRTRSRRTCARAHRWRRSRRGPSCPSGSPRCR